MSNNLDYYTRLSNYGNVVNNKCTGMVDTFKSYRQLLMSNSEWRRVIKAFAKLHDCNISFKYSLSVLEPCNQTSAQLVICMNTYNQSVVLEKIIGAALRTCPLFKMYDISSVSHRWMLMYTFTIKKAP